MLAFILRRLLIAVALLLALSYGVWLLTTTDGTQLLAHPSLTALIPTAYLHFLNQVLHGDLGVSLRTGTPVLQGMQQLVLASLLVIVPAFLLQEGAALSLGILAATRTRKLTDQFITTLVTIFSSLPLFWFCLTLLIIFAENLHWFPFGDLVNYRTISEAFNTPQYWAYFHAHPLATLGDLGMHLVLPVLALAVVGISADALLVRTSMLDVLSEDYIRAARARGLPQRRVLWRHALRNALLPLLTSLGLQLPRLVFAASLVEFVFNIPGLGRLFLHAVYTPPNAAAGASEPKDPHVITAYFLLLGVVTVASSLLTDLAYGVADPRVRAGGSAGAGSTIDQRRATGRQLRIAGRAVPWPVLGGAALAAVVLIAVIGAVHAFNADKARTVLPGTWVGTVNTSFLGGPAVAEVTLNVTADGKITGTGKTCVAPNAGGELPYTVTGDTDGASVLHLEWVSADFSFTLDGSLPQTANNPLKLSGALVHVPYGSPVVTLSMRRGSRMDYDYLCAPVLHPK